MAVPFSSFSAEKVRTVTIEFSTNVALSDIALWEVFVNNEPQFERTNVAEVIRADYAGYGITGEIPGELCRRGNTLFIRSTKNDESTFE